MGFDKKERRGGVTEEEWFNFRIADLKNRINIAKALARGEEEEKLCKELEVLRQKSIEHGDSEEDKK